MNGYFKLTCQGFYSNLPHKLTISKDGSANKEYTDLCQAPQYNATIAYNNDPGWFELDDEGNLVEYPVSPINIHNRGYIWDYEIMKSFLENYHITPTWIDCNFTWGWFDEETDHWTGAVGKVGLS